MSKRSRSRLARRSITSPCALCHSSAKALRKSHVLPEFLYKRMYNNLHQMHVVSAIEEEPTRRIWSGLYERLLCGNCEDKLQEWEDYAARVMNGNSQMTVERRDRTAIVKGIDYRIFKLFLLSILWRSSVASDPVFSSVSLGTHEEPIRQMLLHEDPGPSTLYPCLVSAILDNGRPMSHVIPEPTPTSILNRPGYRFVFAGHMFAFVVADISDVATKASEIFLNEAGVMPVCISELGQARFLLDLFERLDGMGRLHI